MGKKCIPGVLCIENMTLFLLFFILVVLVYLYFKQQQQQIVQPQIVVIKDLGGGAGINQPPQNDMLLQQPEFQLRGAVPVNIESRGPSPAYTQVGILTRGSGGDLILPLMGRRLMRDKMQ